MKNGFFVLRQICQGIENVQEKKIIVTDKEQRDYIACY